MFRNHPAKKSSSKHFFAAALASTAILTAGCANMASTAAVSDSLPVTAAALTGHVHGGNQPIAFATVTLNFAGQGGIGSAGSVVATTTTADDGLGSFSFVKDVNNGVTYPSTGNTYSCPNTGADPLVYLVARGGNTQNSHNPSVNNTASVFLAPLGRCKSIDTSAFLNVTEVTTVATIAALQQYMDPVSEVIGADGTLLSYQAITNSFNLIPNLVNISTGNAVTSTTLVGGSLNLNNGVAGPPAVSVTATPASSKINTIANIIASCVNSTSASGAPCVTLFANATPPAYSVTSRPQPGAGSFPAATDVLQAAYYMFTNPTNGSTTNLANLYNLPVGVGAPFQPALTSVPIDWTVGISYSSSSTCGTNSDGFINSPYSLGIDLNGNLWIANGQTGSGNLSQITPNGTPVVCLGLNANSALNSAVSTIIDSSANIWQGSANSLTLTRYTPISQALLNFTLTEAPLALSADGLGNLYFTTATGNLYQIPSAATAVSAVTPVQIASNLGTAPTSVFTDNTGTDTVTGAIWTTSGSTTISRTVPTSVTSSPGYLNGFTTTQFTTGSPAYALTVTAADVNTLVNNVLVSLPGTSNMLTNFTGSGTSYAAAGGWPTAAGLGGLAAPLGIALDGRGNIWAANNTTSGGLGSVSEISAAENALSPATGFQKSANFLTAGRSIIVDQSGNVWVGGDGNNFVTEIVGAAVPIYQPFADGLTAINRNARFQTIP